MKTQEKKHATRTGFEIQPSVNLSMRSHLFAGCASADDVCRVVCVSPPLFLSLADSKIYMRARLLKPGTTTAAT